MMMMMMKMTMYQTHLHCIETVDWLTARVSDLQKSLTSNYLHAKGSQEDLWGPGVI